ncbi:MAG: hypothetical protein ABSF95_14775 [Verrucomicrobiota bacterium]|jgi:hypothetical protein
MEQISPGPMDVQLSEIHLHSSIPLSYRQEVEDLFFFNPKQGSVRDRVRQHVDQYGAPTLCDQEGLLTLKLGKVDHAQTLFMLMGSNRAKLLGLLLYVREGDCLRVLYLALKPAYTLTWQDSCFIISHVLRSLKETARRIKGVNSIQFSVSGKNAVLALGGA